MIEVEREVAVAVLSVETSALTVQANETGGYDLTETAASEAFGLTTATINIILPDWMIDQINSSETGVLTLAGEALTLAGDPLTIGV